MKEVRRRPWGRRCAAAVLTSALVLGLIPAAAAQELSQSLAEALNQPQVAADWKFGRDYTTGSIADGSLIIEDQSGNQNDLEMQTYGQGSWEDYLTFSDDSMTGEGGSLLFNGDSTGKTGADFITVDSAPINSAEFRQGYTLEFLYYFPEDWTAADSWMSLIGRQGTGGGNPEGEQGTMYASISNCKEIQFITGNADGDHTMSSAAWSVSMDEGGVWYHIAIISDGHEIATYVNGCEAFRDYVSDDMAGMYADPADGRFRVGSSWWDGLDKFLQGGLQEIRISGEALDKDQWLVPNPEDYVEDFGSNETYTLRDEDNYNFVLIPDTQNTVEYRPDVMDTAIDELIASVDELNIKGVIHMGDVVDDAGDAQQYNNAKDIFYQLPEAGVKFLVQPGNHDNWTGNGSSYWHYFGQDSKEYMSLTSSYLTPKAWSGAMFVEAGSYTYMIISLACEGGKTSWNPTSGELEWFESMLQQYPNCPTIVTRHDIQNCSDTQPSAIQLSSEGEKLWEIVKKYPQVFMMVGGHSHGSGVEVLQNDAGQDVISILTDLQFSYNGGNGWFRYLEFDEDAGKIYYSVYSPYAASLDESEKTFFDVNFLTGPGHEGEIDIDFDTRFAGMAHEADQPQTEGQWMTGEYHTHTLQSNDASEPYMTVENSLNAAFREDLDEMPDAAKVDNLQYGDDFDYLMLADHLRNSPRDPDGSANETARWSAIGAQQREIQKLQIQGKYDGKLIYSGFEWDMMALDHATVGLMDQSGAIPFQGLRAFEWLFSYDTSDDRFYGDEEELYGPRQNTKDDVQKTYDAVEWVSEHYPDSFILPNHPSRHNNGDDVADSGEVTIENLRTMNDIAPDVVFGFEGMPGNQLDPSCELPADDIRAGADEMISVTGGVWDALLSEGRRFYNFANSDFHFKISSNEQYSSGYWASEFSRNYTWVEPGDDQQFTFSDVVEGMRSGNSYAVNGELISDLSFTVSDGKGSATMGQDLNVGEGDEITVTIQFQIPAHNNYQSLYNTDTGLNADNTPEVDHVDLIMGHVTGKVDPSQYSSTANTDAKIVKTFSKEELAAARDEDGVYTLTYTTTADSDLYFRVRGLSSSEVDENGDPVTHERTVTDQRPARFDYINDYNYTHLSFYANPVWVSVAEGVDSLTLQPGETAASVNLNWYAPAGTASAQVKFGDAVVEAEVSALTTPTKVDTSKYTDTGKLVCKATVDGLEPGTAYDYQISNDGGQTWSRTYTYTTPEADAFTFAFTSDPQIKESGETNAGGWNPSDGTNQTGWDKMMEVAADAGATLMVSAGDQVEDQSWGKSSEYEAFFAPEEMTSIAYAPAVGNHDRHYMFADHFNLPNEMGVAVDGEEGTPSLLEQVKTTFRGQNSGTSQSHGNYIQATADEIANQSDSNGVTPNADGIYDFTERREMETKGNYYYLYNNVLFVTLNTGAYPGGNDAENAGSDSVASAAKDNSEAEAMVENFRRTLTAATEEYAGQYDWLIVTHHKSTQTVAKHAADSDIENYVDAGFESLMDQFDVDFVLGGHDHVYSRSYVLKDGKRNAEALDTYYDPDGTIYLTGNCASDMQYYTPFETLDKNNNADYPLLANGESGSAAYLEGNLPYGNQEYNQEYSPSYAIFDVEGNTITVNVYNLSGDSEQPTSEAIDHFTVTKHADGGDKTDGQENGSASLDLTKVAGYTSGQYSVDGGVMEIVSYNAVTGWAYAVNGQSGLLTAIPLKTLEEKDTVDLLDGNDIDVKAMVEAADASFSYGDMTSVAVSPDGSTLAAALQAQGYADAGRVALFTCNANGSLTLLGLVTTGVQPDMVTFADDNTVLTADEGEPRQGYGEGTIDPKGSVTVIDVASRTAVVVDFTSYDAQRDSLVSAGIVLKKDAAPSADLEPEYIAVANGKAYATLQENNAIAVLDIASKTFSGIYSAGFEDYSTTPVDIDKKDGTYSPKTYESLMGIRMPDGIAAFTRNGKTYLLTANEGDSREWGDYLNEDEVNFGKEGKTSPTGAITAENSGLTGKVVFFRAEDYDGLNPEKDYLFGGRSFTLYEVTGAGIKEIFTSGDDFEALTARYFPDYFNTSNDNAVADDRSGKKGPEAESVTVGTVNGKFYAFVALERTGGVMVYDVTDPANVSYVNYINSRAFSSIVPGSEQYDDGELDKWVTGGDVAPEGLAFVPASASPTGEALLLTACEVSGTVAVYELAGRENVTSGFSPDRDEEEISEPDTPLADQPFTDVAEDHWASEAIGYVVSAGLFQGTSQTTFSPEMTTTRGMLMTILARMDGTDTAGSTPWYQKGMEWAVAAGVSDGTNPEADITREQLAAMLYRYARYQGCDTSETADLTGFADCASVSSWAADAMAWAVGSGLINGKSGALLDPQGSATRAEAAQLLMRFCQNIPA